MGHLADSKEAVYRALADRLNSYPVGAPVTETLMAILKKLYTEAEAAAGSRFPMLPMPLTQVAEATGMSPAELEPILEGMASKGLVVDIPRRSGTLYLLSPLVVGFFEYTFMRMGDPTLEELAGLFERYFSEKDVASRLFGAAQTKLMRTLVYEKVIPALVETEVLDYERASEIIRRSGGGALSPCACRHKASHLGKACGSPIEDICTSLGKSAEWLVRRGFGRAASVDDLLRNLERSEKLGLVLLGDNILNQPAFICHCCGCCCMVLRSLREKGISGVHPSSYLPVIEADECAGCGTCIDACHLEALQESGSGIPVLSLEQCIGCGVCAAACPGSALTMKRRIDPYRPPGSRFEQMSRIAAERGNL